MVSFAPVAGGALAVVATRGTHFGRNIYGEEKRHQRGACCGRARELVCVGGVDTGLREKFSQLLDEDLLKKPIEISPYSILVYYRCFL
jgi:hypothetical protein